MNWLCYIFRCLFQLRTRKTALLSSMLDFRRSTNKQNDRHKVFPSPLTVDVTVLCKSNDNDNRQISRFVLPIFRRYLGDISRILATRQNDNSTRYRSFPAISRRYLVPAKYRHSDISKSVDIPSQYIVLGKYRHSNISQSVRHTITIYRSSKRTPQRYLAQRESCVLTIHVYRSRVVTKTKTPKTKTYSTGMVEWPIGGTVERHGGMTE